MRELIDDIADFMYLLLLAAFLTFTSPIWLPFYLPYRAYKKRSKLNTERK